MNNDKKVETAVAGLNCWASYATVGMPPGAVLLPDKEYAGTIPLLAPFRTYQIRRIAIPEQRQARTFNRRQSRCQVIVKHTIKYPKTYLAVGSI